MSRIFLRFSPGFSFLHPGRQGHPAVFLQSPDHGQPRPLQGGGHLVPSMVDDAGAEEGPALGQHGVNIVEFTKQFNARTADKGDLVIPVVITVYADRSFSFITKTPPAAVLLKKACKIQKASGTPNKEKVATISKAEVQKIAETKMPDLNAASLEAAMSMIAGTARSMGIVVED